MKPKSEKKGRDAVAKPAPSPGRLAAFAAVIAGASLAFHFLTWKSVQSFVTSLDHCDRLFADFVLYFRPAGAEILTTGRPAAFFFYPPFAALAVSPWGRGSAEASLISWGVFQSLSIVLLALLPGLWIIRRAGAPRASLVSLALLLTSLPLAHNFAWGQVSVPLVLLMIWAFIEYDAGRRVLPAALLALAVSFKIYPILVVPYFVLRKDKRFLAWFLGLGLAFSVAFPLGIMGPERAIHYTRTVMAGMSKMDWTQHPPSFMDSQYVLFVMNRLFHPDHVWSRTAPHLIQAVSLAGAIGLLFLLFRLLRRRKEHEPIWALTLSLLATPFILRTSWPHYFAFLPFVQVFVGIHLFRGREQGRVIKAAGVALLSASVLFSSLFFFRLFPHWSRYASAGYLFFANLFLLALVVWMIQRPSARPRPA